jgi:hypothetical protein
MPNPSFGTDSQKWRIKQGLWILKMWYPSMTSDAGKDQVNPIFSRGVHCDGRYSLVRIEQLRCTVLFFQQD